MSVVGTPNWLAPEAVEEKPVDFKVSAAAPARRPDGTLRCIG
jgi:hypothetical protein